MIGIDAVHGNNNVVGATLFPHNSGLGAMRDPALIHAIGRPPRGNRRCRLQLGFGPTLAVPQDIRWGRAYEGYSQDPKVVASYAGEMVKGLQGAIQQGHVAASVKHFLGDGGTKDGVDQGDTVATEADLIRIHIAGYVPAINAGVMTVMASFIQLERAKDPWQQKPADRCAERPPWLSGLCRGRLERPWAGGRRLHHHRLRPDLQRRAGHGHGARQLEGPVRQHGGRGEGGQRSRGAPDDAVRRILRVKFKLGLFDTARPYADQPQQVGSAQHRAIARAAVRESLVLLKNEGVCPSSQMPVFWWRAMRPTIWATGGRLDAELAGRRQHARRFPRRHHHLGRDPAAVKAGGGSAIVPDGAFTTRPMWPSWSLAKSPMPKCAATSTRWNSSRREGSLALLRKLKAQGFPRSACSFRAAPCG
jgi:beta-glucosidase